MLRLDQLVGLLLGCKLDKPEQERFSKWDAEVLTEQQRHYAAVDAYASFLLGRLLLTTDDSPLSAATYEVLDRIE